MKKSRAYLWLLFFCLSSLLMQKTANAADITIGKYKYPSVILIPIISIIISLLILLVLIFRIAKRKERVIIGNVLDKLKVDIKKVKKTRRVEKEDKKKEQDYLSEIKRFKRHLPNLQPEQAFEILSGITKNFFKKLLGLNYEFTYNELTQELKKRGKRREFIDICQRFSEAKYSGSKIAKEELARFADELENFLRKEKTKEEEQRLGVSKAFQHRKGFFGNFVYTIKALREGTSEGERKKKILGLIKEEEEALKKDMDIAKDIYHKILSSYYKLPPKEKKEVYERMNNFYNEINSMLFSSIYSEKSKKQLEFFANKLAQMKEEAERVSGKEAHEKIVERVHEKEAKPHEKGMLKTEPRAEMEDLKKLEKIEEEAKERIKLIGESIVKQAIEKELMPSEEKQEIHKKIRQAIKPTIILPAKPLMIPEPMPKPRPAPLMQERRRTIEIEVPKIAAITTTPTHIEAPHNKAVEKASELKKKRTVVGKQKLPTKVHGKTKKLEWLDREAEGIRGRLEKLHQKHGYIG